MLAPFVQVLQPFMQVRLNGCDDLCKHNRSQVQGSTFRVKDKEGIKDPKSSLRMLILPNYCQFGCKFWIRPDEADAFFVNTHPKCSPGTRMEPLAQTWDVKI
jgi:hypothetical protein